MDEKKDDPSISSSHQSSSLPPNNDLSNSSSGKPKSNIDRLLSAPLSTSRELPPRGGEREENDTDYSHRWNQQRGEYDHRRYVRSDRNNNMNKEEEISDNNNHHDRSNNQTRWPNGRLPGRSRSRSRDRDSRRDSFPNRRRNSNSYHRRDDDFSNRDNDRHQNSERFQNDNHRISDSSSGRGNAGPRWEPPPSKPQDNQDDRMDKGRDFSSSHSSNNGRYNHGRQEEEHNRNYNNNHRPQQHDRNEHRDHSPRHHDREYNRHEDQSNRPDRNDSQSSSQLPHDERLGYHPNEDPRGNDPSTRLTKKASSRGNGRNTESFDPSSTLVRPDLRVLVSSASHNTYPRKMKHDDVIIVPELFGREDDWSLYYRLVDEMRDSQQKQDVRGSEWISWHEGAHLISKNPKGSPTFHKIIDRLCEYFKIRRESIGTRFNWYRDSCDWKPFHHDSAAFNPVRAKNQNITVGVSFGATRELAFIRAKPFEDEKKCRLYFPQTNNGVFSFGRDANILWKHGVNALPESEQDGKGRISIILWGLAMDVVEEEGSPSLLGSDGQGPHAQRDHHRGGRGYSGGRGYGGRGGGRGGRGRGHHRQYRRDSDGGDGRDGYDRNHCDNRRPGEDGVELEGGKGRDDRRQFNDRNGFDRNESNGRDDRRQFNDRNGFERNDSNERDNRRQFNDRNGLDRNESNGRDDRRQFNDRNGLERNENGNNRLS